MKPVVEKRTDALGGEDSTHPAFGMISYHHVQGGDVTVTGSDLKHNNTVCLRVHTAYKHRSGSNDRFHSKSVVVEVEMSQQQWASFIASPNCSGVPCTLRQKRSGPLEQMPTIQQDSNHALHKKELEQYGKETVDEVNAVVDIMREMLDAPTIKKTDFRKLYKELNTVVGNFNANLDFYLDQHKRMMDNNVHSAKADIEAYVTNEIYTRGLSPTLEEIE